MIGIAAPLSADPARVVWITGFGAAAIWAGGMAIPRYRRAGRGRSILAIAGITTGITTIAMMGYAFLVMASATTSVALPAPAHWLPESESPDTAYLVVDEPVTDASGTIASPVPATPTTPPPAPTSDLEAERLELGQSLGTASFVLRQTAAEDGTWPASLAITTDGSTLMSPDGIILAPIPAGAQVLYSTSSDRTEFSLTLIGPSGVSATYVSTSGVVETSVP